MSARRNLILMRHFPRAIAAVTQGMKDGADTHEADEAWKQLDVSDLITHLSGHYVQFLQGNKDEDHLRNMICRALMVLEMREKHDRSTSEQDRDESGSSRRPS